MKNFIKVSENYIEKYIKTLTIVLFRTIIKYEIELFLYEIGGK